MKNAKKLQGRGAARYRFREDQKSYIRFTSNQHRDIHTTKIFDISTSGLSFTTSKRLAPRIGTILKLEIAPTGGIQIALLARVVRIEEPSERSDWAKFPGTVRIGVAFHKIPRQYVNIITETIQEKVSRNELQKMEPPAFMNGSKGYTFDTSWLFDNMWTMTAGLVIVGVAALFFYFILQYSEMRPKATEAPWASNFFDKVIKKPGQ